MQKQIEPTYLRYIFDSLSLNTIHKDNISALPEGLIGMYEEAFSNEQNVSSRERFLKFFTAWSLLKKEVSTTLMADLLDWEEWEVIDFLSVYTKWFNSPSSGKYLLYHERLRVFFLQKISSHQLNQTNQTIISKCQLALEQRNADEWEVYALEHLPSHLLIAAMQSESDGAVFKKLVYDTSYWNRQLEINKGYDWSKKMLNQSMTWAAKQNTDELIECALNKIDLHHMEQNDAPRIVELVAQNDIERALQRIESFGGNDKEGLQRKFILYMLCLMELTLLDSKDKPFRRDSIGKILKHFDENMPIAHSILNWNDFFPSYLVFTIACNLKELIFDVFLLFNRTDSWDIFWIKEKGTYTDLQYEVMIESANCIISISKKIICLIEIASVLYRQKKNDKSILLMKKAIEFAINIENKDDKDAAFKNLSIGLVNIDMLDYTLEFVDNIYDANHKNNCLEIIANSLSKQGLFTNALECVRDINDVWKKCEVLNIISTELAYHEKLDEALALIKDISDEYWKGCALTKISTKLENDGKYAESASLMNEALICCKNIDIQYLKSALFKEISNEFFKQEKYNESISTMQTAIELANGIEDEYEKRWAIFENSIALLNQGKISEYAFVLERALDVARNAHDDYYSINSLIEISIELLKLGDLTNGILVLKEALKKTYNVRDELTKSNFLNPVSIELSKIGKLDEALKVISNIRDESQKYYATKIYLYYEFINSENYNKILSVMYNNIGHLNGITDNLTRKSILQYYSIELAKNDKIEEALKTALGISDDFWKCFAIADISSVLTKKGNLTESENLMNKALELAKQISYEEDKCDAKYKISKELCKQGKFDKAFSCADSISDYWNKSYAFKEISIEMFKLGKFDDAETYANKITDEYVRSIYEKEISIEMIRMGKLEDGLKIANNIKEDSDRILAMLEISSILKEQGIEEKYFEVNQKCLDFANNINSEYWKSISLKSICTQLLKQEKIDLALEITFTLANDVNKITSLAKISTILFKKFQKDKSNELISLTLEITNSLKNDSDKNIAFNDLAKELAIQSKWTKVEEVVNKISLKEQRQSCWRIISQSILEENDAQSSLFISFHLKKYESKNNYLIGWLENIEINQFNSDLLKQAICKFPEDIYSLENLLQKYTINQLFNENLFNEKLDRLNHTLNIQWAIDIANKFNKN